MMTMNDDGPKAPETLATAAAPSAPTNTTEEVRHNPLLGLLVANGGIEAQEARGQHELVNSSVLPREGFLDAGPVLEAAGVVFGENVPDDLLFVYVTLPAGWEKRPTEHPLHSELVDEKGRVRARIFYKAAFYDRKAFMRVATRFGVGEEFPKDKTGFETSRGYVTDGGARVFETDWITIAQPSDSLRGEEGRKAREDYSATRELAGPSKVATAWLDARYPEWTDATAYWEVP